ncbi:alpha/beta-hydrolase [Patellaria atrata CBS 101060]|uniref:Peroxisome assembly protein 12 n=1 Tax=Patellaria atrata CBS 101060 TaxID=1346257 RepID=A0A9P4VML3_9PEZI|nr:alpha/beta-hydrolase [Patellaria atrata CBS 101060]
MSYLRFTKPDRTSTPLPSHITRIFVPSPDGPLELLSAQSPSSYNGPAKAPFFFAHGGTGHASVWLEWMTFFSQRHNIPCYALSIRGHGFSWYPSYIRMVYFTSKRALADDLVTGIKYAQQKEQKKTGKPTDIVLVGHSSGGGLSQIVLSSKDVQAKGLALVASIPCYGSFGVYWRWWTMDPWFVMRQWIHFMHPNSPLSSRRLVKQAFFCDAYPDERVDEFAKEMSYYESYLWPIGMMFGSFVNVKNILQQIVGWGIGERVLILAAENDRLMSVEQMQRAADTYRTGVTDLVGTKKLETKRQGVRFGLVRGAGHHLQNDLQWEDGAEKFLDCILIELQKTIMEFMTNLQNGYDELKPSLFELLSEQQLSSLLPPSLRYLLAVATHRRPRYLLPILNSFDELYALVFLLLERHYLKTTGGSFTENFYGLKRERVLRVKGGEVPRAQLGASKEVRETLQVGRGDIWRNLAIMVGFPYLKRKLDEGWEVHAQHVGVLGGRREERLPDRPSVKQRLLFWYKWFLRKVYPSINAAYYFSLLTFNLAYLFDNSKYHHPLLWLVGTRMRRLGAADHKAIEAALTAPVITSKGAKPGQGNSIFNPRTVYHTLYPRMLSSLRLLLPTSIFALKFLEWWYASDFARQLSRKATEGLALPPPVISGLSGAPARRTSTKLASSSQSKQMSFESKHTHQQARNPPISSTSLLPILTVPAPTNATSALCPICVSPVVNATAAPTGYVYCYACIHKWVEGTHERQTAFMEGGGGEEGWDEEGSREGRWESGKGRCAVSGRRVLGGTEGLRRVLV